MSKDISIKRLADCGKDTGAPVLGAWLVNLPDDKIGARRIWLYWAGGCMQERKLTIAGGSSWYVVDDEDWHETANMF